MADDHVYIALTFRLNETVTPMHLADRVARACFKEYALREDEAVIAPDGSGRVFLRGEPIDVDDLFGRKDT